MAAALERFRAGCSEPTIADDVHKAIGAEVVAALADDSRWRDVWSALLECVADRACHRA